MGTRKKNSQLELRYRTWGGRREGAGRKPGLGRRNVPHRMRPAHAARHPVHVTLRAIHQLPSFRDRALFRILRESLRAASRSPAVGDAFRIVHFSVQRDHVHVIVEAASKSVLSRGVQGLAIRLARATSRALGVHGSVWADRYHARPLKTPREVRNAIVYVLMNAKKHGCALPSGIDPCSSAPWTDAIRGNRPLGDAPVMAPRTWLAGVGWRGHGRIAPEEKPA